MTVNIFCSRGEGPEGPRFHLVIQDETTRQNIVDSYLTPEQYALSMTGLIISGVQNGPEIRRR